MLRVLPSAREKLLAALEFSEQCGARKDLEGKLLFLHLFGCRWDCLETVRCDLANDFAEHSFCFLLFQCIRDEKGDPVYREEDGELSGYLDRPWLTGGLIYHPGSLSPDRSLSVELVGSDLPHWSIHT